jgi:hypothetical protein
MAPSAKGARARLVRVAAEYKFCLSAGLKSCLCAGLAAACATTPPPTERVAAARAMVTQAQPIAARDAALELNTAQAKLAGAEQAMQQGEYESARRLAEQAEVDAKLAWTVAENVRAQRAAAEVDRSVQALRDEIERRKQ